MKKKMQKYLSGSNEGFSLVELIIVIAIMAILIGVVALAVIPYLEKSQESKDLQALSTLSGALSSAVADVKATGTGTIVLENDKKVNDTGNTATGTDAVKVQAAMADVIGDSAVSLGSNASTSIGENKVRCYYDSSKNVVAVYVKLGSGSNNGTNTDKAPDGNSIANCKYNDNQPLIVSNGGGVTSGTGTP